MATRPDPTWVYHFTRIEHLETITRLGLLSDTEAQKRGVLSHEVGNVDIKSQRARREVPIEPGGYVSDYVPFYFAPRSPMLYAIDHGNVDTYRDGCDRIVYLVTTTERLREAGLLPILTDRNAALWHAAFRHDIEAAGNLIDWDLMKAKYWAATPDDPTRVERRMAECLVHRVVPWASFSHVIAKTLDLVNEAVATIDASGVPSSHIRTAVRPVWYF